MALIFAVIYPRTIARVGYRYHDAILVPTQENGNTVYSGQISGKQAQFTVSDGHTVAFRYGDQSYGPYVIKEDASAIPPNHELSGRMTGIEVREGNHLLFRGGVMDFGDFRWLYGENGTLDSITTPSYVDGNGIERDEDGHPIDPMKPSALTVYELTHNPELTHKGQGLIWFGAVFICILNALSILFADELFRWNLSFQIRNVERAEPSDWEIAGRYAGWTVMMITALVLFIIGLR